MKYFILLLVINFSQDLCAQKLTGELWHINKIIGRDLKNTQEYTLTKIDSTKDGDFVYGNKIIFNTNNTFNSFYSASCGNDCFPSSTGTFKMVDKAEIQLFVEEFVQEGDCEHKKMELNIDLGVYCISIESDKVIMLNKRISDLKVQLKLKHIN